MSGGDQPPLSVAVVMEREADPNPWEAFRFRLVDVMPDPAPDEAAAPRCLRDDGRLSTWLHTGFEFRLYPDECKGYYLNLTSGRPSWFVSWRPAEGDAAQVEVTGVSMSYIEADRRLAAEERVENMPLPPELCDWLQTFTRDNFRPEEGRRVRAMSFLSPEQREAYARAPLSDDGDQRR